MYAYVASRKGQYHDHWEDGDYDTESGQWISNVAKPHEIAYWRKHPNLHAWMEELWIAKGCESRAGDDATFNGVELELTSEDIDQLEQDLELGKIARLDAAGFFWGDPSDEYYYEEDVKFITEARSWIFLGMRVFYNSSW